MVTVLGLEGELTEREKGARFDPAALVGASRNASIPGLRAEPQGALGLREHTSRSTSWQDDVEPIGVEAFV